MQPITFRYQNNSDTTFKQHLTIFNAINETPSPESLYAELFRVRLRLKFLESPECRLKYSKEDQEVAKAVDLITLPESVEGTNCFNCKYIKKWDFEAGFCMNKKIELPVTSKMCCALWDAEGTIRSWEK